MNIQELKEIGLTESEIKVYFSLLKLKESTAGPIVDDSKVTRSKIYDILERLKNKGLVSSIIKESTKHFRPADPSNLLNYLNKKEIEIKKHKDSIKDILPELENQYKKAIENKSAEVFLGLRGMENAFNVIVKEFNSKEDYYAFGAGKGENVEEMQIFFDRLHKERVNKKIKAHIIFNEFSRGLFTSQEKSKWVEAKYLIESTPAAINIYKEYTLIAILIKEPITFLIKNKEVSDSFKEYFKVMWKIAKR